nr:fibro-slime domain-containing protein [Pseudobutyrivibrio sp.]
MTEANVKVNLTYHNDTNVYIKLSLKPASFKNPDSTMVNGATLVKYTNNVNAPGDFKFSEGGSGTSGSVNKNALNYGKVHQGIASTSIENGFTINGGSTGALFPGNDNPSYIQKYFKDVGVQFLRDEEGYWTLDSSVYNYTFNQSSKQIKTNGTNTSGFFPFDRSGVNNITWSHDHVHHFGMEIPINFNINSNGRVDANNDESEDTVFRFSGDDDVFVYIDNRLVLDLGGIHNAVQGQINFRTGEILVQGHYGKDSTEAGDKTLVSSYDSKVYSHTSSDTGKTVYDLLSTNLETFSKRNHLMTVVYFERGDYDSNCRISYNFDPNRTTTAEFTGMKIDAQTKQGLAGAQFKLYTDPECQVSAGTYAAESEDDGTIRFVGLAKGDYYMKEVAAPTVGNKQYVTPEGAVWKLSVTVADAQENLKATLYAYNDEAKSISLMS